MAKRQGLFGRLASFVYRVVVGEPEQPKPARQPSTSRETSRRAESRREPLGTVSGGRGRPGKHPPLSDKWYVLKVPTIDEPIRVQPTIYDEHAANEIVRNMRLYIQGGTSKHSADYFGRQMQSNIDGDTINGVMLDGPYEGHWLSDVVVEDGEYEGYYLDEVEMDMDTYWVDENSYTDELKHQLKGS